MTTRASDISSSSASPSRVNDTVDEEAGAGSSSGGSTLVHSRAAGTSGPDPLSNAGTAARVLIFMLLGGLLTLAAWRVLHAVSLPAFNASFVTRALATACTLILVIAVAWLVYAWVRDRAEAAAGSEAGSERNGRPRWRSWLTEAVCGLAPAGLVVTSLGIPLSATRLYLDGIQVDQGFRTQFLTRMAETAANQDMNYIGLPTFYPIGWFWLGGRMSALLDMPGWEVYQPWALVSFAVAASALYPVWRKLTGSLPAAAAIALVTTAIILASVPDEPYAAVVAMFAPAAAVMGYRAMRGSWAATLALAVYLGVSACFYTLYTGIVALTMVVFALVALFTSERKWVPIRQLAVMGFGSIAIAVLAWGPYLAASISGEYERNSTAPHFLPLEGSLVPLPFFQFTAVGLLCLVGLIYVIARAREPQIGHLGIAVAICYAWIFLSMAATLAGTTLLGFRVGVLVTLMLSTAGILALAELRRTGIRRLYPEGLIATGQRTVSTILVVLFAALGLSYFQQIPEQNEKFIDEAYAGTDGYGERGDLREPDTARYYAQIDDFIKAQGRTPADTVVFTDEINFMSYHPYYGFNAFTSHYANPLGEFEPRNEALTQWAEGSFSELADPDAMLQALDDAPWRAPDVFIFRGREPDDDADRQDEQTGRDQQDTGEEPKPWKTHIAHDIFPNAPNIRYEALFFNPEAFDSNAWETTQIGPFTVVVRT